MATISAVSAFSGTGAAHIDKNHPDLYKLYPTIATNTDNTLSARVVMGKIYSFIASGYNAYTVQMCDYEPNKTVSDIHAKVAVVPAYRASTFTLNGTSENHLKLFSSDSGSKYTYTGSSESSDYGSYGPIICKYARFIHLSGNVAYDYQRNYSSTSSIEPLAKLNIHSYANTAFDDQIYKTAFSQPYIAWLSSYVESNLDENVARFIVFNPAIVGQRFNTPGEFHSPIRVWIEKPANSYIITFKHEHYLTNMLERRVGRFVFDFEILI